MKMPSCEGAMLSGPRRVSAYCSPIAARPTREWVLELSVRVARYLVDRALLQMVLQVAADAVAVGDDGDGVVRQPGGGANTRALQHLDAADRPRRQDDPRPWRAPPRHARPGGSAPLPRGRPSNSTLSTSHAGFEPEVGPLEGPA